MTAEAVIPLFFLGLLGSEGKNEVDEVREAYNLRWSPKRRVADNERETFTWTFIDGKKRYLRGASFKNSLRVVSTQIILRPSTGQPWQDDVHIANSPTIPSVAPLPETIFTWSGDIPFKGEVVVETRDNVVADVLFCAIMYEEK